MDQCARASVLAPSSNRRLLRYSPRGMSHLVASLWPEGQLEVGLEGPGGSRKQVTRTSTMTATLRCSQRRHHNHNIHPATNNRPTTTAHTGNTAARTGTRSRSCV